MYEVGENWAQFLEHSKQQINAALGVIKCSQMLNNKKVVNKLGYTMIYL